MKPCEMIVGFRVDDHGDPVDEVVCGKPSVCVAFSDVWCCAACVLSLFDEQVFTSTRSELLVVAPMPRSFAPHYSRWVLN